MKKALVIVDMLRDFVEENGALPVTGAKELVENINAIRTAAYKNNILVLYVNDAHAPDDPEFKRWPKHAIKGTWGAEVIDALAPQKGDLVIEKQDYSFFTNKYADSLLKENGIEELIITGVATEYCVRDGAIDGAKLGYKVNLVVDAIAGVDLQKGNQYTALLEMGKAEVEPKYTAQVLEEIVK